ncbi:hypothetical protein GW916_07585 [bacterium]|uniref:SpoVT-AbrB domain-containing protein n=2 Tax=Candidatus Collieribacteriota TaxID=1752725 RepID=A0A2H0WYC2_9BACT|nr:hypothetical protein [bacterium]PIS17591.1 MAG: hypothetical protein COT54_03855 [Candidatus Collierbacteria bacterium CG09_land_8_20_14_0_10_46_12]PIW08051.1 MAG: hypothetical protein COW38_01575 [Candidatus Collierbacteria bacterium CG17_big_fil_post_rev_8_21_14_2_50_45_7]
MLNSIATSNAKHQVVIPGFARKSLGIKGPVQYFVTVTPDQKITFEPFTDIQISQRAKNLAYLKILKSTQGAWAGDDWPDTEAKQRKIEISAAKKLKNSW